MGVCKIILCLRGDVFRLDIDILYTAITAVLFLTGMILLTCWEVLKGLLSGFFKRIAIILFAFLFTGKLNMLSRNYHVALILHCLLCVIYTFRVRKNLKTNVSTLELSFVMY